VERLRNDAAMDFLSLRGAGGDEAISAHIDRAGKLLLNARLS
jgi:hypothetical protein